jgi:hypothetical protein
MRNKEVGRVMNRSEGAVKLLVFRGVSNLRRTLAQAEPGTEPKGDTQDVPRAGAAGGQP